MGANFFFLPSEENLTNRQRGKDKREPCGAGWELEMSV